MNTGLKRKGNVNRIVWSGRPHLSVLFVFFLVGVLGGTAFAFFLGPSADLSGYLREYCVLLAQGHLHVSFFSVLWDCVRWPLLTVLLGITVLGIIGIPALFVVRGFLLAFSSVTFGLLLGPRGIAVSVVLFAVLVLLGLPALFILGCDGLRAACLHLPSASPASGKQYRLEIWLICIGILAVSVAVQWTVIPGVLTAVCSRLAF